MKVNGSPGRLFKSFDGLPSLNFGAGGGGVNLSLIGSVSLLSFLPETIQIKLTVTNFSYYIMRRF